LHSLETTFYDGVQIPVFILWSPIFHLRGFNVPSSIIEEDLMIEGNIRSSEGSVDIKGRVIVDVSVEMITIQLSGSVDGAMSATKIVVVGSHTGSLKCDDLKLASTSRVQADVVAKVMATENGAKVRGKIDITGR
jgi:cytoskeletal protein CcmA (bactofilin family)